MIMSFGKLLATGKSLVGGKGDSRYRVAKRAILPNFGSPKNPFVIAPNRDAVSERPAAPTISATSLPTQAADPVARAVAAPTTNTPARTSVFSQAGATLAPLSKKFNLFSWLARRKQSGKSVIPRFGHKPVQEELHLENVRVVRNDLSDADLEVVRVGAGGNKNLRSGTAWGHLVSRIFGPGSTD
jgi:hypothetical protein